MDIVETNGISPKAWHTLTALLVACITLVSCLTQARNPSEKPSAAQPVAQSPAQPPPSAQDLLDAIAQKQSAKAEALLNQVPGLADSKDRWGKTPLYWSCVTGDLRMAELLLAKGAHPAIPDNEGYTALHTAAGNGWATLVERLIAAGADVNSSANSTRATPLHFVAGRLVTAAMEEEVKALIGVEGVEVAVVNNRMQISPAAENSTQVARLLLSHGARIDAQDKYGQTPLFWAAVFGGDSKLVALLLDNGAKASAQNLSGRTPLHEAAYNASTQTVELLVARGADVNAKDANGNTALIAAAASPYGDDAYAVVQFLLAAGADANARAKDGWSALGMAKGWEHERVAALIGQSGGKDYRGW